MNRFLLALALVLSVGAAALGAVALGRSGQKVSGTSLRIDRARIATLQRELTTANAVQAADRVMIDRVNTCLPELWQYVNSATLQQDGSGSAYISWGQQIASVCNKLLTGYSR